MLSAVVVAFCLLGQFEDMVKEPRPKPFEPSPEVMARIKEAIGQAGQWSFHMGLQYRGRDLHEKNPTSTYVKRACLYAAYMQIAKAYQVSMAQIFAIQKMRSSELPRFTREKGLDTAPARGTIRMATEPWRKLGAYTRFDPAKVILPEKVATLIGHQNPKIEESDLYEPVTGIRWKFPRIDPDHSHLVQRRYVTESGLWPTTSSGIPSSPHRSRR